MKTDYRKIFLIISQINLILFLLATTSTTLFRLAKIFFYLCICTKHKDLMIHLINKIQYFDLRAIVYIHNCSYFPILPFRSDEWSFRSFPLSLSYVLFYYWKISSFLVFVYNLSSLNYYQRVLLFLGRKNFLILYLKCFALRWIAIFSFFPHLQHKELPSSFFLCNI